MTRHAWHHRGHVRYRGMIASDLPRLVLQPSQIGRLGLVAPAHDESHGAELVASGPAWVCEDEKARILCLAGFAETFPGRQAVAWALISSALARRAHIGLQAFMRQRLAEQPYRRIEAIARAASAAELGWLRRLGFVPEGIMREWGPLSEDHVLFRYVREGAG
jgi:hypothetical protein